MAEGVIEAYLEYKIKELYVEMVEVTAQVWEMAYMNFNPGQQTLFENYVLPTLLSWGADELEEWPDAEAAVNYAADLYDCYDMEVMESAFSDTIELPVAEIERCGLEAAMLQDLQELIAIIDIFE